MVMKIAALARTARESVARGLEALQAGDAPERLLVVAEPLSKAQGMLVEMEVAPPALARRATSAVLASLRTSLALLQEVQNLDEPASQRAMRAVAAALSRVLEIERAPDGPERKPTWNTRWADVGSATQSGDLDSPQREQGPARAGGSVMSAPDELSRCDVEAALGVHSATHFYKGLSGGDVIAAGGLFVATYQLPPIGQKLHLRISMPGGFAFEATGVVAWTREAPENARSAGSPGFGAQLSEINAEGLELIERYVRNREPLFHDDA
jgi:hypothetical protein